MIVPVGAAASFRMSARNTVPKMVQKNVPKKVQKNVPKEVPKEVPRFCSA
jgi:hypothetical protein